uniref:Disease resistance RPP13-like protein 4 n=1 Tax=Aegilops tauschii TaxID=37682 RepID=M8CZN2_AEGTA
MVLSSLGSMLENPAFGWMNHVLNLSYNDLPHDLKTCILYLVTFPEDSIIRKDHLLRRWIAEGFVMEIPYQDLKDIAQGYLTELINRSIVQDIPCIRKFELVRVMDLEASFSRNISCDLTGICRLFLLRYLRIRGNSFKLPDQIRTLKHLKTLELNDNLLDVPSDVFKLQSLSHLIVPGNAELADGMGNMRALRTLCALDFPGCPMDRLRALAKLTNLRDLQLSYQVHRGGQDPDVAERKEALVISLVNLGCNLRSFAFSRYSWRMPADVLSHWEPAPRSLERLHLLMCSFSAVPAWIASLDSLTRLGLRVHVLQRGGLEILGKLTIPCRSSVFCPYSSWTKDRHRCWGANSSCATFFMQIGRSAM